MFEHILLNVFEHILNIMEVVVDLTRDDNSIQRIEIVGEPRSLPRARSSCWRSRQKYYNPATKDLNAFKSVVREAIPQIAYPSWVPVSMTVLFYLKRPNYDFKNVRRGAGRLKGMLPWTRPQVPDIDNLAKFVLLDGMNGLVYAYDRQVVKLCIYKLLDNEGDCQGRTVVTVSAFDALRDLPVCL
jgi:Holliday junction resolvase RusA-like endonuclease